jgi:phospholipid/cholesterol/gamma-HCH transport system substrate-binding protein
LRRELRVGLLVLAALAVAAGAVLMIGEASNLFVRKNHYFIRFFTVGGLKPGGPVQLNGVDIGTVERVILPRDPTQAEIEVWVSIDRNYARRLRAPEWAVPDSAPATKARIQTLGLLGDKYIELNSGAESYPPIPPDGQIPAARPTNVDALLASGEDVVGNVVEITHSLSTILGRIERGQGLLGELTSESAAGRQLQESLLATVASAQRVAANLENGQGPLPRLLNDRRLAARLESSIDRLDEALSQATQGPGLLPGLLNDPAERARLDDILSQLQGAAKDVKAFTTDLDHGQGLVPRLVRDEDYGRQVAGDLRQLVEHLSSVADKLDRGNGTAARLINDSHVYDSVNDVFIGINQSRLLRWLIQNRQKSGVAKRYKDAQPNAPNEPSAPNPPNPPNPPPLPLPDGIRLQPCPPISW